MPRPSPANAKTGASALRSMTGFARNDGAHGSIRWHWELRSVNGRGLDLRLRLPPGFEAIEADARDLLARKLSRGNVSASLSVQRLEGVTELRLNKAALAQVLAAAEEVRQMSAAAMPAIDGLLAIRGVLEPVEPSESEAEVEARSKALLAGLGAAADALVAARAGEGQRLGAIVSGQLATMERLVTAVEKAPQRSAEMISQRLRDQIAKLFEQGAALDEGRLYQEAALLATRFDIEEELKRLGAHIAAARDLMASREPAGRRLDFLTQELNREANTLCSKSSDIEITRLGLELKVAIDQMREQVQNIE